MRSLIWLTALRRQNVTVPSRFERWSTSLPRQSQAGSDKKRQKFPYKAAIRQVCQISAIGKILMGLQLRRLIKFEKKVSKKSPWRLNTQFLEFVIVLLYPSVPLTSDVEFWLYHRGFSTLLFYKFGGTGRVRCWPYATGRLRFHLGYQRHRKRIRRRIWSDFNKKRGWFYCGIWKQVGQILVLWEVQRIKCW